MTHEHLEQILLWTTVINYVLLIIWWAFLRLSSPHDWLYNLAAKPFNMTVETFDACNVAGIGLYKIGIILFFLTPYIAMRIVWPN